MAKYKVIFKGLINDSQTGQQAFTEQFANAYNMDLDQASQWIAQRKGVIFEYDDSALAEQGRDFLESIGAIAEITGYDLPSVPPAVSSATKEPAIETSDIKVEEKPLETRPCPKCGNPVPEDQDECPYCHIFISRYEQMMARKTQAAEEAEHSSAQPVPSGSSSEATPESEVFIKGRHNAEDFVNNTAKIYVKILTKFLILSLLLVVIPIVVAVFLFLILGAIGVGMGMRDGSGIAVVLLLSLLIVPVFMYIFELYACAIIKLISEVVNGRKPTLEEILRSVIYWMPVKLILTHLILGFAMLVAFLPFFFFLAIKSIFLSIISILVLTPILIYMGLLTAFVVPVVVVEGIYYTEAINRARSLMEFKIWRCFAVLFVCNIAIGVAVGTLAGPFYMKYFIFANAFSGILQLAASPLSQIITVLLYYELRVDKDAIPTAPQ